MSWKSTSKRLEINGLTAATTCSRTGGKTFTGSTGKVKITFFNPNKNIRPAERVSRAFYIASEILMEKPKSRFIKTDDNTIYDSLTSLMWMANDSRLDLDKELSWDEAHEYVKEVNEKKFAGFDDWRLAGFEEAQSLFAFSVSNRDKDGAELHIDPLFAPGGGHNTWTYEEKPDYQQYAMMFSYVTGNEKWEHKDNEYCHVRAVRDEQKESWEPEWRSETKKFEG